MSEAAPPLPQVALARGLLLPFLKLEQLEASGLGKGVDLSRARFKPRPEDYAAVFVGPAAARAEEVYGPLWTRPPVPRPHPGQTLLQVLATPSEALRAGPVEGFPRGLSQVGAWLRPGRVWVRFAFLAPGEASGTAFDGLVFVDDHWAWFPKPWHALRGLGSGLGSTLGASGAAAETPE